LQCAAWDTDRHGEITFSDRAVPNFVAALALPDQRAAGGPQQVAQRAIELLSHLEHDPEK